jgi:polyisoprenyl-phosphate glycosyltransferase
MSKLISVVVPAYNESACVDELAVRLQAVFERIPAYEFEVIIVENGSTDDTYERLRKIQIDDERFKIIQLARNFRTEGGIAAGLEVARGDAVVIMTADLQDPPEVLPELIDKWEQGYEHVYAVVRRRHGTNPIRRLNAKLFYWLVAKLTGDMIPRDVAVFRLADRRVYEAVNAMPERNRIFRGLFAWVGFRSIGVEHDRAPRFGGRSKSNTLYALDVALKGVAAYSVAPLKGIGALGLAVGAVSAAGLLASLVVWIVAGFPAWGFGLSIAGALAGVVLTCLGIVATYVGLVYEEVKARPSFVVRERIGF